MTTEQAIVPWVLDLGKRRRPYLLPEPTLYKTLGETYQFVKVEGGVNIGKERAICIPTPQVGELFKTDFHAFALALEALSLGLTQLGTYAEALAKAPREAANPLHPTVIHADDPAISDRAKVYLAWETPKVLRLPVTQHTAQTLTIESDLALYDGRRKQADKFICPDDASWKQIETLYERCSATGKALEARIEHMGTYMKAQCDRRYAKVKV